MNGYITQSYFKKVCDAYCVALKEKRRILKESKVIQSLQRVNLTDEMLEKYINSGFSGKEITVELKTLGETIKKYEEEKESSAKEYIFWKKREDSLLKEVSEINKWIEENNEAFIITTEEEIMTLICFIMQKGKYPKIRTDGKHLEDFPKGKKWYEDFLEAYLEVNKKGIEEIYNEI